MSEPLTKERTCWNRVLLEKPAFLCNPKIDYRVPEPDESKTRFPQGTFRSPDGSAPFWPADEHLNASLITLHPPRRQIPLRSSISVPILNLQCAHDVRGRSQVSRPHRATGKITVHGELNKNHLRGGAWRPRVPSKELVTRLYSFVLLNSFAPGPFYLRRHTCIVLLSDPKISPRV